MEVVVIDAAIVGETSPYIELVKIKTIGPIIICVFLAL